MTSDPALASIVRSIDNAEIRGMGKKILESQKIQDDRVYTLLLEKLRRNPLDETVFQRLYEYADKCEDKNIYISFKRYGRD